MAASQPWILMCRPDHYGIEYEINAWMSRERPANRELAAAQWQGLHDLLLAAGAKISLLDPMAGLPDLVFTANAAMIYRRTAVIARFRHEVRQRETPCDEAWLAAAGFAIKPMPEGIYFEGAGDALFCGDTLFAGYRMRSDATGHQQVAAKLGVRVIPLELVNPYYYHLDTCFCPLTPGEAIWYPGAFDEYGRRAIAQHIERLIEVRQDEAEHFACNAVVVGREVVTNAGCPGLHEALRAAGYKPRETDLSEFVKAGGSAKCLTLRLDGEEAAAWRENVVEH